MGIRAAIESGEFIVTGEVAPPKGWQLEHMLEEAEHYRGLVAGINVTDLQSAVMRTSSLVGCIKLKEAGLSPILQMVCRDRNRLSLQSELLSAAAMGINEVLCITGDYTTLGDHPDAKPVFDLDSVSLLKVASDLMNGADMAGIELDGDPPEFTLGCVVNPGMDPVEPQIIKLKKKIDAGAEFCQTQAVYDADLFEQFMEKAGDLGIPILAGTVMLKSPGMARFMNANVAGVQVPEWMIDRLKDKETRVERSIEMTADLLRSLKSVADGVHIMPLGWDEHVPAILEQAGLL